MEYLYFLHLALNALRLDPVAHAVGFEQKDNKAAGEVLQVAGKGHTDGHTGRSEESGERSGVDAKGTYDGDDEQDSKQNVYKTAQKSTDAVVDLTAKEHAAYAATDDAHEKTAHHVDDDGGKYVLAGRNREVDEAGQQLVDVGYVDFRRSCFE